MTKEVKFNIRIAGRTVSFTGGFERTRDFCSDYIDSENVADASVCVSASRVEEEYLKNEGKFSRAYCETVCFLQEIVNIMPDFGNIVFHGAAIKAFGKGYVFSAPSGTGKSTHVALLKKHFPDQVGIINGDKPILGIKDREPTVFSSPWCGKESWQTVSEAPLGGIVILKRGTENTIKRLEPSEYFEDIISQAFIPERGESYLKVLEIVDEIAKTVPFYLLECNISKEAAEVSFDMMANNSKD